MKQLLLKMRRGDVGTIAPSMGDAVNFDTSATIKSAEWPEIVEDAFIWMDYFSIPQPGAIKPGTDAAARDAVMESMKRAIDSASVCAEVRWCGVVVSAGKKECARIIRTAAGL